MLGHPYLEAAVDNPRLHAVLDGVTAAVIGLVVATAIPLAAAALTSLAAMAIFAAALATLYAWRSGIAARSRRRGRGNCRAHRVPGLTN